MDLVRKSHRPLYDCARMGEGVVYWRSANVLDTFRLRAGSCGVESLNFVIIWHARYAYAPIRYANIVIALYCNVMVFYQACIFYVLYCILLLNFAIIWHARYVYVIAKMM
jgi:hypothetical protein